MYLKFLLYFKKMFIKNFNFLVIDQNYKQLILKTHYVNGYDNIFLAYWFLVKFLTGK